MTDRAMNAATAIFSPWDSLLAAAMGDDSLRAERSRPAHAIRRFADNMSHVRGDAGSSGEIPRGRPARVRFTGRIRRIHSIVRTPPVPVKLVASESAPPSPNARYGIPERIAMSLDAQS